MKGTLIYVLLSISALASEEWWKTPEFLRATKDLSFAKTYAAHPKVTMVASNNDGLQRTCLQLIASGDQTIRVRYNDKGREDEFSVTATKISEAQFFTPLKGYPYDISGNFKIAYDDGSCFAMRDAYRYQEDDYYIFKDDVDDELYKNCTSTLNRGVSPLQSSYDGCVIGGDYIVAAIDMSKMPPPQPTGAGHEYFTW